MSFSSVFLLIPLFPPRPLNQPFDPSVLSLPLGTLHDRIEKVVPLPQLSMTRAAIAGVAFKLPCIRQNL